MKKLIVAIASIGFVLGAQTSLKAQDQAVIATKDQPVIATQAQVREVKADNKKKVAIEDLPAGIKATLATDALKDFKVESATVSTKEDGKNVYELTGKKGEMTEVLLFNEDGTQASK